MMKPMTTEELFDSGHRRRLLWKRGRERAVANRHPWIFAGAIAHESGPAEAAVADLMDDSGAVLSSGLYSSHSQIRLRALTFGDEELSADLMRQRIVTAVARRAPLLDAGTNAVRLIHAEGDDLSGLVVDRYDDMVVVEIANAGWESLEPLVVDTLQRLLSPRLVFFKNDLPARKLEQLPMESEWSGSGDPVATIVESGLRFVVEPAAGQKTGFFLDQRENRRVMRSMASGKRVLNLFSYSGAFGVYAAAGGAASVVNVDSSQAALGLARTNYEINGTLDRASFVVADAFGHVRGSAAAGDRFDVVICD